MRSALGSFLFTAAVLATACGTQSPASPSAAMLHGDSHRGGSSGSGDNSNGTNTNGNNGSNNGSNANHENEIQGLVTAVGASSITVNSQVIVVDASTSIVHDGTTLKLSDIKVGDRVEVKAAVSGTTTTATRIQVETPEGNDNGDDNGAGEAEVNGTITTLGTGCPALTLTVGTTKVTASAATQFEDTTCGALAMGDRVEVKGTKQTDGSVAASRIERQ